MTCQHGRRDRVLASALKKGLLHQALNSAKVAAYGGKPSRPFRAAPGPLGTFTPGENVTATPKAARGISLMEPSSLNPVTPSAGSSTSASASAVPLLQGAKPRPRFVGNYVARVGYFGWWIPKQVTTKPSPWSRRRAEHNLFQDPFIQSGSGHAARWTLNQVQGDDGECFDICSRRAGR